ncbi:MAG: HipA N-terminal domain-containing protein [Bacteroidales bacterium]|nr:HipA N-terminal domain-containing protein [Bacteroidales bacterium]
MRQAFVNINKQKAGILKEVSSNMYTFEYCKEHLEKKNALPVSLTLPLSDKIYTCDVLFPCFFNLLSEGGNKKAQCKVLHIEPDDYFGLLLATAQYDTIGFLTFTPINE